MSQSLAAASYYLQIIGLRRRTTKLAQCCRDYFCVSLKRATTTPCIMAFIGFQQPKKSAPAYNLIRDFHFGRLCQAPSTELLRLFIVRPTICVKCYPTNCYRSLNDGLVQKSIVLTWGGGPFMVDEEHRQFIESDGPTAHPPVNRFVE